MRILYLGSGAFGIPTLAHLAAHHTLVGIVTQPDRPAGRGSALTPTPVAAWAAQHAPAVPIFKPDKINDPGVVEQIRALAGPDKVDGWVVIAFGQKLGKALMAGGTGVRPVAGGTGVRPVAGGTGAPPVAGSTGVPPVVGGTGVRPVVGGTGVPPVVGGTGVPPVSPRPLFAINLHASLLPRWRGAAPINAAILAGDTHTGNSVIALADRMDAGVVYAQSRRAIDPAHTAGDLHDLLAADGPALVESVLAAHAAGRDQPVTQDESLVTLAPKLAKADGWVDFTQPAGACSNRVHAFNPWPTVTAAILSEPVKLLRAAALDTPHSAAPGTLLDSALGLVACGPAAAPTTLQLLEVQPANKRPMPWPDFARGRKFPTTPVMIEGRNTSAGSGGAAP